MGSFKDLTGKVFEHLTVLEYAGRSKNKQTLWLCRCDCGNEKVILANSLVTGKAKSCGCRQATRKARLVGKKFGMLTVIEQIEDYVSPKGHRDQQYICECECGNRCIKRRTVLTRDNAVKTCGCQRIPSTKKDMTNVRFGMLTGVRQVEDYHFRDGRKEPQWLYKCDCGNYVVLRNAQVLRENKRSCGCAEHPLRHDLTGQTFGWWKVLGQDTSRKDNRRTFFTCQCRCGKIRSVLGQNLMNGTSISCGCMIQSILEHKTQSVLDELLNEDSGISFDSYIPQFSVPDLLGTRGGKLRFDFALMHNGNVVAFVECNGKQHYEAIEYFGGAEQFERQRANDNSKMVYAQEHNIPMIIIPYMSMLEEKIKKQLLEELAA